ncbi:MAG: VWA domain-containing protein [Acidobacteriota bacterium]
MRIAVLVVVLAATAAAQQPQTPVFRIGVEALIVEASVLDRDGKPVTDLTANDFTVTLDGKPRRVRDARFFGDGAVEVVTRGESTVPGPVTNGSEDGRIVVFVVDRDSIAPGNEKVVLDAASHVVDGLRPADAAGVLSLPGDSVHLTRNRVLVRTALSRLTGTRPRIQQSRDYNVTWDEALGFEHRDPQVIAQVIERECPDVRQPDETLRNPCPPELESYAREFLLTGRFRTQSVLANLTSLAKQLAPMRGPKQIVFLSGGFPFGQDLLQEYNRFARQAADAQITFYAVHLDGAGADVTIAKQSQASAFGGRDFAGGMGTVSTMTGGAFFSAGGSANGLFDRIRTEMNNFYELAVEMEGNDKAATSLEIDVKVSRPGMSIRNRRRVLPPARLATNTSSDPLSALLRQPIDLAQVPIALSAYTMRGDEASTLRTIVGIETGSLLNDGPAEWAFVVFNEGNVVATGRQKLEGGTGPWLAALSAKLLPGQYELRAAVRDHAGRAGVVERAIEVGLRGDAKVQFSDLLIGVADANGRLQPASQIPQGAAMTALFEVISADASMLEKVRTTIEIVPGGSATPVKRFVMAARTGTLPAILNNQAEIAGLAPGRYTAIATPMIDNAPLAKVSRIFEIIQK